MDTYTNSTFEPLKGMEMSEVLRTRVEQVKREMGSNYCCHPSNQVKRQTPMPSQSELRDRLRVKTRP